MICLFWCFRLLKDYAFSIAQFFAFFAFSRFSRFFISALGILLASTRICLLKTVKTKKRRE